MRHRFVGCLLAALFALSAHAQDPLSFELTLTESAVDEIAALGLEVPIYGRAYVIISRDGSREPREQIGVTGVPFWGKDVADLRAGSIITLAADAPMVRGYPLNDFAELEAGMYYVQAFLNVYTTFPRADGHTVRMHLNSGAGQSVWRAPGNATSVVRQIYLDPAASGAVPLTIDTVLPPLEPLQAGDVLQQGNPADTRLVKYVKIKSEKLSAFWGRDMYIGANVLLPDGYDPDADVSYPALYMQGHFPGRRAPLGFTEGAAGRGRSAGFADFWTGDAAPRMFVVTIRDANPYYDTAYSVNSANVGPYGDAIMEELIPHLESTFRMIPEGWARILAGGSTGGWEALAMQVFYPKDFGGSWAWCPDAVDFNYHQIVNIYEDDNAYTMQSDWHSVERPNRRRHDGNIVSTMRMENYLELATAPNSRSGGQWAIWEAVYGPVGANGFPQPIWDPISGEIDKRVASYWRQNYDLHHYLHTNWSTIGSDLRGKIYIATGDMDSYYLDNAVYLLEEFLNEATNPPAEASVEYGRRKPHCWIGSSPTRPGEDINYIEFIQQVRDHLVEHAPSGTNTSVWDGR